MRSLPVLFLAILCILSALVFLAPVGEAARQCAEGDKSCSKGGADAYSAAYSKKSRKKKKKKKKKRKKKRKKKKKSSKRATHKLGGANAKDLTDAYGVVQADNDNFVDIVGRNKFVFAMFTTETLIDGFVGGRVCMLSMRTYFTVYDTPHCSHIIPGNAKTAYKI